MTPYRNWYAIYTRPRWEKKVASLLERKGIECYCPLNKVPKQWADRKKIIYEPLFTSYVFVCISNEETVPVKETDGVLNFVYWLGKPAVIRQEEIEAIKQFLQEYETVSIERTESINPNDKIQIIDGPLMMREGRVMEVGHKKVKVLIPSIGFNLVAEVEITNIAKMKSIA
ncbi:UpxY family transcription antiterminator [Flavisolibacter tropicus]|uniref:Antitermination protein NusG n=1 Tax=Flavisolibacter tropicus TaxID=1492898 RepID=A0A172U154_9BACT|nr:UpxY family transcription antiterminator [Flavisolibacter tropicus]ANE52952.1 antitermination protein NusG [Flavisolibacter tropicus]